MYSKRWMPFTVSTLLGVSFALAGCGQGSGQGSSAGQTPVNPANAQVVHVQASDFTWTLDKTTFSVGKPIEFDLTSKQGTHGFSIVGTSVTKTITAGQPPVKVYWTPTKPGTYTIRCDVFCGSGHQNMFTSFKVQ
ncbi:hypothetical protein JI721_08925 [Alicyclobacillus cycloheptanicus]|uniref:Cytochrome c oxidase subunit 2 n=1 Tax=Alicyclobacillus cycloheptanicus TaxID=1457 RepID=A0ABT9XH12_9BACL|nr:hypothetical protein [Alicyclobacillus cycloheptanicus]MDQ0189593.1 cytochrome c oxidase subunit 2 [Alicyclobacillus cycloheptanicus]WDL99904.1 hypothetical protein JI721_08925 [Alicyclobacillus cycloheptanicus]